MKRKTLIAAVLFAVLLTACQNRTTSIPTSVSSPTPALSSENPTPTDVARPSDTPTPTEAPLPTSSEDPAETPTPTSVVESVKLSDTYSSEKKDNVYRVNLPNIPADWSIDEGEIRDGYILLRLRTPEPVKIVLALAPILNPEEVKFFDVENYSDVYRLANDGQIIEVLADSNSISLRSGSFEKIAGIDSGINSFAGCDSKNRCWYLTDDGCPAYINLATSDSYVFSGENYLYADSLLYEDGDDIYLAVSGGPLVSFPIRINLITKKIDSEMAFVTLPEPVGPYVSYFSNNDWYYSKLTNLSKLYTFRKSDINETLWKCADNVAITSIYNFDFLAQNSSATVTFNVIDLTCGGISDQLTSDPFGDDASLSLLSLSDDGLVLFISVQDDKTALYIWDIRNLSAQPDESFSVIDADSINSKAKQIANNIQSEYGVRVFYDEASLDGANESYECIPCSDDFTLLTGLSDLYNCLSEYPKNFFNDTIGNFRDSLDFYICDGFISLFEEQVSTPSAFASYRDNSLVVCIAVRSMQDDFESTLVHEMMHIMDDRIDEYSKAHSQDILEYWRTNFSSDEYPYYYSYVDENGYELSDTAGTVLSDDPNAWYIDAYSRANPAEDRARVLQYMYRGDSSYFESKNLQDKGIFLITVIRKVFPSIAECDEPVLWEKMFGIDDIDFSNYNFPPYVPKG